MSALWDLASDGGALLDRTLCAAEATVSLGALAYGSSLGGRLEELRGRNVLIATSEQLPAALALLELDGVARRLVVCPPGVSSDHLAIVMAHAEVDAVVGDVAVPAVRDRHVIVPCDAAIRPFGCARNGRLETEWILLTSGTSGPPKMVLHTLSTLRGAIPARRRAAATPGTWATFYDIRRYGGLQIFLRAMLGGASMVLSSAREPVTQFLERAAAAQVTHISGTPSHWRRALMSGATARITPGYVRLSGEIADQAVLDHLRAAYPHAEIAHAFASTEAGVAFAVGDGLAGFPASYVGVGDHGVEIKIEDGSLRIRSGLTAHRYLGDGGALRDDDGFVDTGDMVELRGHRYHFVGRRGGIINVGGLKVHPEEIEAVINAHPDVSMSVARTRKNPIMGAVVVADVVLKAGASDGGTARVEHEILSLCRDALPRHKVPAAITFVPRLAVAQSGKLERQHA